MLASLMLLSACESARNSSEALTQVGPGADLSGLQLVDLAGEVTPLSHYRGKLIVLNLWATWCAPCRREMPSLQRLSAQLDGRRFVVLGLAVDKDPELVREFVLERQIDFARHVDPHAKIVEAILGVRIYPSTLIISPQGRLLQAVAGPRPWDVPATMGALERAYRGESFDLGTARLPSERL